jgi:hypothetical protein
MLHKILIINVRGMKPNSEGVYYIGRAWRGWQASPLGNPFHVGKSGDRMRCIEMYRRWLWKQVQSKQGKAYVQLMHLVEHYRKGEIIVLGCWCCPEACHAEVVRRAIQYLAKGGDRVASAS